MQDPSEPRNPDEAARAYLGALAKRELRSRMRSVRAVVPRAAAAERARAASKLLLELPEFASAKTIIGFSAVQKEADPADVLSSARASGWATEARAEEERALNC